MIINTGYQVPENPDTLVTHRILNDAENRLWIIFQTSYRSLAYGISEDEGKTWSPAREIMPDVSGPFAATVGTGGSIHIVAKKTHPPDINIVTWNRKSWLGGIIMSTAGKRVVTCCPLVLEGGDTLVHVLFAVRSHSSDQWTLKHTILDLHRQEKNDRPVTPIPAPPPLWPHRLDFFKEILYWSGDIMLDGQNTLHLAGRIFTGGHYQIFYSSCSGETGQWQEFIPLTGTPLHRGHPRIIAGAAGKDIHVLYQVEEEKGNSLVCQTLGAGGRWGGERVLARGVKTDFMPEAIKTGAGPVVYWAGGGGVHRAHIDDSSPPSKILDEKINYLSAVHQLDKVYLAFTGKKDDRNTIYLLADSLDG
ncbi:MAG: hypothetical protein ACOY4I_15230 [Bacillota bacterium]